MPRIIAAAISQPDGIVYVVPRPLRHHHVLHHMHQTGNKHDARNAQGFITDEGVFVDRKQAMSIATAANQIIRPTHGRDYLMSEDVW